jgi:transposase
MPRAYSDDLRTKLLRAYAAGRGSLHQLASQFGVSYGYTKKIRRQQLQSGQMERPRQLRHGPTGLLSAEIKQYLRAAVAKQPDVTLAELKQQLRKAHQIEISQSRLWYWLRGLGLRHKKTLRAEEQQSGENLWRRQVWWELVAAIDPAWLVFLDESGVTTEMTRHYGWGLRSERVREAVPAGHWRTLTILAALTTEGVLASMSIESPTDGDVFLAFVEQALAPRLQPGHLVILDNPAAHKVDGGRQLIEACGASLLYLPPYSPDFNPIEQAWSKLKQLLRGIKARLLDQLEPALATAIAATTPQDAQAFFRHCGYRTQ